MIQPVPKLKNIQKSITRQVNSVITTPPTTTEYLNWSNQPIEFSREEHLPKVPRPRHAPMVLMAQIGGYDVSRVFMDTSSDINLIYAHTLRAMNISLRSSKPRSAPSMESSPGVPMFLWAESSSMFSLAVDKTSGERSLNLKSWTGHHNITRFLDDPCSHASWQFLTIPT
jgi:hypothetical protein